MTRTVNTMRALVYVTSLLAVSVESAWAQPDPPPPDPCVYCRETVKFGTGFDAAGNLLGTSGAVMQVSTHPPNTTPPPADPGTRSYAEFGSESLQDSGENPVPEGAGSTWYYIRGRWPLQHSRKIALAAWGTTVILQRENIPGAGGGVYERHRVYVLNPHPGQATPEAIGVRVRGNGNQPAVGIPFAANDPANTWKFVETTEGVGGAPDTLSAVQTVATPSLERTFVDAVHAMATTRNFHVAFP